MSKAEEFNGPLIFHYGIIYGLSRDCVYRYTSATAATAGEDCNTSNMLLLYTNVICSGSHFIIGINFDLWALQAS